MAAVFLLVLMKELQIAPEYANRYMNVGFSDGEKKTQRNSSAPHAQAETRAP